MNGLAGYHLPTSVNNLDCVDRESRHHRHHRHDDDFTVRVFKRLRSCYSSNCERICQFHDRIVVKNVLPSQGCMHLANEKNVNVKIWEKEGMETAIEMVTTMQFLIMK